jgi:hypothetical protein
LGFSDSDCEPAEDWLEAIVAAFESDVVALIGGCIEFPQAEHGALEFTFYRALGLYSLHSQPPKKGSKGNKHAEA